MKIDVEAPLPRIVPASFPTPQATPGAGRPYVPESLAVIDPRTAIMTRPWLEFMRRVAGTVAGGPGNVSGPGVATPGDLPLFTDSTGTRLGDSTIPASQVARCDHANTFTAPTQKLLGTKSATQGEGRDPLGFIESAQPANQKRWDVWTANGSVGLIPCNDDGSYVSNGGVYLGLDRSCNLQTTGTIQAAGNGNSPSVYLDGTGHYSVPAGGGPGGGGNVTGPAASTQGDVAIYNDTTGKVLTDSGLSGSVLARTDRANTFTAPTQKLLGTKSATQGEGLDPLGFIESAQPANQKRWDVWTANGSVGLIPCNDDGSYVNPSLFLGLDRNCNLQTSGTLQAAGNGNSPTLYLNGTGAYSTPPNTGMTQLTGDVTAGPGSGAQAATIAASAVTTAKLAAGAVTEAQMTLADVTTQNVATTRHGFAPKAPGNAALYLDGTGAYSTPAGAGGGITQLTGPITAGPGSGSQVTTITANAVTTAAINAGAVTEAKITLANVTTGNVTSAAHGFAPIAPGVATQYLNGAATPAYAQVKESDLAVSNITTNNVSTTAHGFAPILPGTATTYLNGAGAYTTPPAGITQLTGDGTAGPGSGSQALTLAASGVTAGTYGSATTVPVVTVDAKGRTTAMTTATIAGGGNVTGPASAVTSNLPGFADTTGKLLKDSGIAAAAVVTGPASAVAANLSSFSGTTGKILQDSGIPQAQVAQLNLNQTFTGFPIFSYSGYAGFSLIDPSQPANLKRFDIAGLSQQLVLRAVTDAGTVVNTVAIDRTGAIYDRSRTTAMGYWITFTPAVSASGGTWTITTAATNVYCLFGQTLVVSYYSVGTISGAPTTLSITMPGGQTCSYGAWAHVYLTGAEAGHANVGAGGTTITIYRPGAVAFVAGTVYVGFLMIIPVN